MFHNDLPILDPAMAGTIGLGRAVGLSLPMKGLNQTNMSNVFAFALWIVFDLAVIALGAGAFFTGFLTYIIGKGELKNIINAAVIIGFICYSGAMAMLGIDIGQPIRGWFIFWHANIHSMLVEVSFCITCYLMVLGIEFIPLSLRTESWTRSRSFTSSDTTSTKSWLLLLQPAPFYPSSTRAPWAGCSAYYTQDPLPQGRDFISGPGPFSSLSCPP